MITYYVCEPPTPPLLLRRSQFVDESFLNGQWQPTKLIVDFMFGQEDNVTGPIDEAVARVLAPAAFA